MLHSHFSDIKKIISITPNYSVNIPKKFIDPYSNNIMMLPVVASDYHHYCAIQLMGTFEKGEKDNFIIRRKITKLDFEFDFKLYQHLCQFFAEILIKDANLLNKTEYKAALIFIQKHAKGFVQEDEDIVSLFANCKKYGITIKGLMKLPETRNFIMKTRISILASMTIGNILSYISNNVPTTDPIWSFNAKILPPMLISACGLTITFAAILKNSYSLKDIGLCVLGVTMPLAVLNGLINISYSHFPQWVGPLVTTSIAIGISAAMPKIHKHFCTYTAKHPNFWQHNRKLTPVRRMSDEIKCKLGL